MVTQISSNSVALKDIATVQATSTAAESDEFTAAINEGKRTQTCMKLINTGLIDRFETTWGLQKLDHKGHSYSKPHLDVSDEAVPRSRRQLYTSAKIVFAKIALGIEAFLDEGGLYASINTNCVHESSLSLAFLCAVLNSKLLDFIYQEYFGALRMSAGYFQFQAPQLSVLPIAPISLGKSQTRRRETLAEITHRYENGLGGAGFSIVLEAVDQCLPKKQDGSRGAEPRQSDVVHDLLAFLAEEMTRLHTEKQMEVKSFLTWLEDYLGLPLEHLRNKTRIKDYWNPDALWEGFRDALMQNKRRITKVKLPGYQAEQPIREGFEASRSRLQRILERIQGADWLIDQIVYKLYGLTEKEIAIVERRAQRRHNGTHSPQAGSTASQVWLPGQLCGKLVLP